MKNLIVVLLAAFGCAGIAAADEPISDAQAAALMAKYNCQSCHQTTGGQNAPSFHAIAVKYSSDPSAIDELQTSVLNGNTGIFGDNVMPGVDVPSSDLRAMINWILQLQL
jgi:cytochrome c